ncbi:hypothetical protein pb186bvf_015255 [Paramecium bursaria]
MGLFNCWYHIIITEKGKNIFKVSNKYMLLARIIPLNLNFFNLTITMVLIQACCIFMYKGVNYATNNQFKFYNTKYPETVIDINVQETSQSNITLDYSDYKQIVRLGDLFDYDQYDPYLIDNGLLFNKTQFLQINQITLNNQLTFEFRLKLSDNFTSNVKLLYFDILNVNVILNGLSVSYERKGQLLSTFTLQNTSYIHFCVASQAFLFQSFVTLYFIQFSDSGVLQIQKNELNLDYYGSSFYQDQQGTLYIGYKLNQFYPNQYFILYVFRYYQGFFYDDQSVMSQNCKIYLNDKCIICNIGFVLSNTHTCVAQCDNTLYSTLLIQSHNQCIRKCHPKCSTCSSDIQICLTCHGIRVSPPACECPNSYFEDQLSPNCRKYYPDVNIQSGYARIYCASSGTVTSQINLLYTYSKIPTIMLFLVGQSISRVTNIEHSYYIDSIRINYFVIRCNCQEAEQQFIISWISGFGKNLLFQNQISSVSPCLNTQTFPVQSFSVDSQGYPPIVQVLAWVYCNLANTFDLKQIQDSSSIEIKTNSYIKNIIYSVINVKYQIYSISDQTFDTYLDDQPKSVQQFLVQRGFQIVQDYTFIFYPKTRNSTYFQLKSKLDTNINNYIIIYDWSLILASQKCSNSGPCNFYESYITNCFTEIRFCKQEPHYFQSGDFYQACSQNCRTCSVSSTQCTSCYDDQNMNLKNNICIYNCDYTCLTCSDTQNTTCLSCNQHAQLSPQNLCVCDPGFFYSIATNLCEGCHINCLSCNGPLNDECLSCNPDRLLTNNICQCNAGLFEQNNQCLICHTKCTTCYGPSDNQCLSCNVDRILTSLNFCICQEGHYELNGQCQSCDTSCKNCYGPSDNQCLRCYQDRIITSLNFCICKEGYYELNSQCQSCDTSCKTCEGPSSNQCLSCYQSRILTLNNICQCKIGYFQQMGVCLRCFINCLSCYGQADDECLICQLGYYQQNNKCEKCNTNCSECDNDMTCLNCYFDRYLNEFNQCICQPGYFEQQQQCQRCSQNCVECISYSICTKCQQIQKLMNNSCYCSDGYFQHQDNCLSCDSMSGRYQIECNYKNCNDQQWTPSEQCDDGNLISNDGCTNCVIDRDYQCYNRLYKTSICYQCQDNCNQCEFNNYKIICKSCIDGFFLDQNNCLKCDQNCKTCEGFNKCLTCPIEEIKPNNQQKCPNCVEGSNLQNENCQFNCGDGIKSEIEECDDGNYYSRDGCTSDCIIEESFVCSEIFNMSYCNINFKPSLTPNPKVKLADNLYLIQLISTQQVQFNQLQVSVSPLIDNNNNYTYSITSSKNNLKFNTLIINITMSFQVSSKEEIFKIEVNGNIYNQYQQQMDAATFTYYFQDIQILTDEQMEASQNIARSGEILYYFTLSLACIQLILSGVSSLSIIVKAQNYLQYMKYMELNFPPNLVILLNQFSDSNLLQLFDFTQFINARLININLDYEYRAADDNLIKYQQNSFFLANIMPFISALLFSVMIQYITEITVRIINQIIVYRHKGKVNKQAKYHKVLSFIQQYALRSIQDFKNNGIQEIVLISQCQISFSIFLSLKTNQYMTYTDLVELVSVMLLSYVYVQFIFKQSKKQTRITLLSVINSNSYIFCIVCLNKYPLVQLLLISLQSIVMLILQFSQCDIQNLQSIMKLINQIIIEEFSFLLTFLTSILYIYSPIDVDYIDIGFIQISAILITIIYNMIKELKQLHQQYQMFKKKRTTNPKQELFQLHL